MRVKFGIAGLFGFGLSVTVAMADGSGQRGARLLPPRPADEAEVPIYARAAAEPLPAIPESTPVRPAGVKSANPAWLNGNDPNVRPAAGTSPLNSQPRPVTQSGGIPHNDPSLVSRGFDKLKSTFSNEKTQATGQQQPGTSPGAAKTQANASTPFRGTAANGQPVYAGPPAYRWYGWGSVTPGANPYAPTGIPPKASADWYTITGATPGAFPVTVSEPRRQQGTEPPVYVPMPTARTAPGATHGPIVYVRQPANHAMPSEVQQAPGVPVPELTRPPLPTESKFSPIPTLSPIPSVGAVPISPMAPLPVQTVTPSGSVTVTPALGTPLPVAEPESVQSRIGSPSPITPVPTLPGEIASIPETPPLPTLPVLPPVGTPGVPESVAPVMPAVPEMKPIATPAPLPMSVTDEPKWQPNTAPSSGKDWNPAGNKPQVFPETNLQQRGTEAARGAVARAQIADVQPDPIGTAIRTVCFGRATGLEVRWTGTKKLAVSFQCRAADAQKLVNEISGRPELAPYQIDFSVMAK